MIPGRHVKLFKSGRNQAVRIPREFELPGDEAVMRKDGDRLIIESAQPTSLLVTLATLQPLEEEFPRHLSCPSIPSSFDALSARHQHRLGPRPQSARPGVVAHSRVGEAQVCTSIIVAAELRHGATKKASPRLTAQLEAVLGALEVLPFEAPADAAYGLLRTRLERAGRSAATICTSPLRPLPAAIPSSPTMNASSPGSTTFHARTGRWPLDWASRHDMAG